MRAGGGSRVTLLVLLVLGGCSTDGTVVPVVDAGGNAGTAPPSVGAQVDADGHYRVIFTNPAWTFSGALGVAATNVRHGAGTDAVGAYLAITFDFDDGTARTGDIRVYDARAAAVLTETTLAATTNDRAPFPTFTTFPALPHHLSYGENYFGTPSFSTLTPDSPLVFFDDAPRAFILSGGSHFMNASTTLSPTGALSSGIDPSVTSLPAGLSQRTVLAASNGIASAFADWGGVLTSLSGKTRVPSDARPYLERLGYWTDNGAAYYYRYDSSLGYPGTLAQIVSDFGAANLPLAYVQIDSWWYPKGPQQQWNDGQGGIYTYSAAPAILPQGLGALQQQLGVPLVTHARWIDASSPYRTEYAMSKDVIVDLRYWATVADSLSVAGVTVYEQDWLNQAALPLTNNLTDQDAFLDDMAAAMAARGIDLQYCMPLPRHYLQASRYPNLTTTRVSEDRFGPTRYPGFLLTSLLTSSLGAWPWTDVFDSGETDNLLLATWSAGMVGVGDALGALDATSLARAVRPDGVIVKPDVPIVPTDATMVQQAQGLDAPWVAATRSDHGAMRASYVYAFAAGTQHAGSFTPAALGHTGRVYVRELFGAGGAVVDASAPFGFTLSGASDAWIVVPVGRSGIAFTGDPGKFTSLGAKRVATLADDGTLSVGLVAAAGEASLTVGGWAEHAPAVAASVGRAGAVAWDAKSGTFTVPVVPDHGAAALTMR